MLKAPPAPHCFKSFAGQPKGLATPGAPSCVSPWVVVPAAVPSGRHPRREHQRPEWTCFLFVSFLVGNPLDHTDPSMQRSEPQRTKGDRWTQTSLLARHPSSSTGRTAAVCSRAQGVVPSKPRHADEYLRQVQAGNHPSTRVGRTMKGDHPTELNGQFGDHLGNSGTSIIILMVIYQIYHHQNIKMMIKVIYQAIR